MVEMVFMVGFLKKNKKITIIKCFPKIYIC